MKWQVNFVDDNGAVVHKTYVEARTKSEACRLMEQDAAVKTALQKALGGRQSSCDFYIYPAKTLN